MLRHGPIKRSDVTRRLCGVGLGIGKSPQPAPPPLPPLPHSNRSIVRLVKVLPVHMQDTIERLSFLSQLGVDRDMADQLVKISFSSREVDQQMRNIMQKTMFNDRGLKVEQKMAVLNEVLYLLEPMNKYKPLPISNSDDTDNGLPKELIKSENADILCV
ncbi:uncharacterized protein Dwil_GK14986 [Drosophila willistoni]|uniref:Uncharacterized protein n=1 Tax=Drosophila willistoni TaxID=7260 RepID=B4MVW1_DROWI|nr:uncharacterized protein LOC6642071 [Drosophila willistoni]EDW75831.1 uncharacterized protein Dwil_GK14986 [Drosophila willistoni]